MKIGIDISMLVYQGSGVANYTFNFAKSLLLSDKKNDYKLFYSSLRRPKNFDYLKILEKLGARIYSYRIPPKLLKLCWNKLHTLPIKLFLGDLDVFHSSDYLRPPLPVQTISITTLHDLTWKKFPEFHTKDVVEAHKHKLEKTVSFKDLIMVDSVQTYKDLFAYYPQIDRKKVLINYPGIDDRFKKINNKNKIKNVLAKYKLDYPKRYLLYAGAIEPRKNLETVIRMFAELVRIDKYKDFEFLLVGRAGWKNENIFKLVKDLRLENKITFVGFVADSDLPYFYNAAVVCVYLSLYEGFGLPPLEAAKCSVPSLVYSNSSLAETIPQNYPISSRGNELSTLIQLISERNTIEKKYLDKFDWKIYCQNFLKFIGAY